jgi:RNA polymerase sigma-70 factor, ECF subfamily
VSAVVPIVHRMEQAASLAAGPVHGEGVHPSLDAESRVWLRDLRADGAARDDAVARLHALLLRAARFETGRRRASHPHLRGDLDDIAQEAADDALLAVLARLDDFRGLSRFTTWAHKFALYQASVKVRRRAWQGREVPVDDEAWGVLASAAAEPGEAAEQSDLLRAIRAGIAEALTPRQRSVLIALALNEVPIDVLAERERTTRGALYKTLHDARRKLRRYLEESGHALGGYTEEMS